MIDNIHAVDYVFANHMWRITYNDGSKKDMDDEEFAPISKLLYARNAEKMARFMNGTPN